METSKLATTAAPSRGRSPLNSPPNKLLAALLIGIFAVNQFLITATAGAMGTRSGMEGMSRIFSVQEASAMEIMMPILNEGGKTTHLQMMPTITPLAADPQSGDAVADGKAVMLASGVPFYAPEGISFDDPLGALSAWATYENSITLTDEQKERFTYLVGVFPCNFCCGSPNQVTVAGRCGCAHAGAGRGFFTYMLDRYGDTYSNDQLVGEAYRWQALWYPAGVIEDYLLATGRGDAIGHTTHGGAGTDGMHGMAGGPRE